jgi:phosphopantetheinyl transferase (holo-ACP synthase)
VPLLPADHRIRVGIDIVGVERVTRLVTENPEIVDRLFTADEALSVWRADSERSEAW